MFVRFVLATILCLLATVRAAANCPCANPEERVKLGFKQVGRFAGEVTTKFYVGGEEVAGASRTYTAGSVQFDAESGRFFAQSYGCGQFADTVFITAALGQEIEVITTFVDDDTNPGYTEMADGEVSILTVLSMPSAECLEHYAALSGGEMRKIVPGFRRIVSNQSSNTIVNRYVSRLSGGEAVMAVGASAGPAAGLMRSPPDRARYLDAQPLGDLCAEFYSNTLSSLAAASLSSDADAAAAPGEASAEGRSASPRKRGPVGAGALGRISASATPAAAGAPVLGPWGESQSPRAGMEPDLRPALLRRPPASGRGGLIEELSVSPPSGWLAPGLPSAAPFTKATSKISLPARRLGASGSSGSDGTASVGASENFVVSTATSSASVNTPGSVAQSGIGAFHLPISLGHRQGRLLYVASAINNQAFSPATLHLSKDANPVTVVRDAAGNLRQAWLPESFLDVRALPNGFEVRLHPLDQVGSFENGLFQLLSDAPLCVWRIENPNPAAPVPNTVRFVEARDGLTTTHLARWQPASADHAGILTIALHDEAMIETRTYYSFSSPHARGERIQRSAGPLHSPGPVVSDVYEVYREFYNWSTNGTIHEARIQRIEDPTGDALTTTWVYFDIPGMTGESLNGVIYPDGYWERYARYLDGRVAKTFRPFRDSPSHPSVASDANSMVSHVTFEVSGDASSEIEFRYEVAHAQALTRREEIHRQVLSNAFAETRVVSIDGVNYQQLQSIRTARKGLPIETYDTAGRFSRFTYLDGFWDSATESFSADGSGIPARRATETQGSRQQPSGIPGQTLIVVSVSDDEGRLLLEEAYVNNGSPFAVGDRSDWISRTVRRYDANGQLVRETHGGRVVYEAGHYADGRLAFVVDELGVRTDHVYDAFGRLIRRTRGRGPLSPDQITEFEYDAADRLRFETITAGGLSATTEYRYDLAGRRTHVITPDGLVETTSETLLVDTNGDPVRREVIVTAPSGGTTITEFYRDRSLFRRHGTGTVPEFWTYAFDLPTGFALRLRVKQLTDTVPIYYAVTDWAGNLRQETRRGFGGASLFNRFYTYDGGSGAGASVRGLLSKISTTGQADVLIEYDSLGQRSAAGFDLNGNGQLDRLSNEPLTSYTAGFVAEGSPATWHAFTREHRHLVAGSADPVLRAETKSKLTGFAPGLIAERTVLEPSGRRVHQSVSLDRASLVQVTTTRDLAASPSSSPEIRTEIGGLLRSLRRPGAVTDVTYAYDGLDRLVAVNDPVSGEATYGFDDLGRLERVIDGLGRETRFTYYPNAVVGAGQLATRENPDGQTTRFAYTPLAQLHRQWGADTYPTEYVYDTQGRLVGLRTFRTNDAIVDWTQAAWPALGAASGDLTQWTYDYWSDLLEKKTYADGTELRYTYDASLRLFQRINARGQVTTYGYDAAGRISSIAYPAGSHTPGVTYGYDRGGRVFSINDGTGSRTLTYSDFDQLQAETHQTGLLAGITVSRGFDASNRLESLSLLDGALTAAQIGYDYDALSRLRSVTHQSASGGALAFTYAYTPGTGRWETLTATRAGATLATASRGFDGLGRLTETAYRNASSALLFSHGYQEFDAMDRRKVVRREDGKEWAYDYNHRGEVISARKRFPAEEGGEWMSGWQATYAFDAIGNRTVTEAGGDADGANLRPSIYTANAVNQYVQRTSSGSVFFTGEADSDATVDVSVDEQPVGPVLRQGAAGNRRFFAAEFLADNVIEPFHGTSRVRATRAGEAPAGQVDWFYVPQTPELFSHDADGNLISDDRWFYTWDAESRLTSMETRPDRMLPLGVLPMERRMKLGYSYDSQGRRVRKQVSAWSAVTNDWVITKDIRYVYDGWNCIAELRVSGDARSLAALYAWGLDLSGSMQGAGGVGGLLMQTSFDAELGGDYLYAFDGNGNVAGVVNAADGTVAARYDYSAFGELLESAGPVATLNTYRFSTKPQEETGLYYYGYRYYNPSTGRWLSRDPIEEEGGLNLYGMVGNDPLNNWDYLGLTTINVDKCTILIYISHRRSIRDDHVNFDTDSCSRVGVITCWPSEVNKQINPMNLLKNSPMHNYPMWPSRAVVTNANQAERAAARGEGEIYERDPDSPRYETHYDTALRNMLKAAMEAKNELLQGGCCRKVTLRILDVSGENIWASGPTSEIVFVK